MSASDRTPGPASKDRRASAQSLLRRSCPETLSTTCVEKAGETLASRPTLKGKDTSSKACTSSSPYNLKQVKPSRATWGSAQIKVAAVPRRIATSEIGRAHV